MFAYVNVRVAASWAFVWLTWQARFVVLIHEYVEEHKLHDKVRIPNIFASKVRVMDDDFCRQIERMCEETSKYRKLQ